MSEYFRVPKPENEPIKSYAPGTIERKRLISTINELSSQEIEAPMVIGGERVYSKEKLAMVKPHDHQHILGYYFKSDKSHIEQAIKSALLAKPMWEDLGFYHKAAILLKAAELLSGPYREKMNAATMLCQSKNVFQAEIDAACELIDFWRYNPYFAQSIYESQPVSPQGMFNRMDYRGLEGFVYALTPFNFTSIAGNLPTAPALMENTVVWKPSNSQIYSAQVIMEVLEKAGMPPGVINLIYPSGSEAAEVILNHPEFSGIHFTGSTEVFRTIKGIIGRNEEKGVYRDFPRVVGETGGKDFVLAHHSADPQEVVVALDRAGYEFQGQKCSAASRAYIPSNLWKDIKNGLLCDISTMKVGPPEDFSNFVNAVIDNDSYKKIKGYIDYAARSKEARILWGGKYSCDTGYFVHPTIIQVNRPDFKTMMEEIFGPVLSIYVYDPKDWDETLDYVDRSPYALTGSIFGYDRRAIEEATKRLRYAAGNFYINDKPTGAVVGQQPFGGSRASGTNDKAGSADNLKRWISPRTIKETFVPPKDYRYPFMG